MGRKVCTSATRKEVSKRMFSLEGTRGTTSIEPKPKLTSPEF